MLNKFAAPIDYLAIGHIANDVLPGGGVTLGGTVAYAALTAQAIRLRPGILSAFGPDAELQPLESMPIAGIHGEGTTTFENITTSAGRRQCVLHVAPGLHPYMVPEVWRRPAIVHFAPLLDEIDLDLLRLFPGALMCLTPQGWLRSVGPEGKVAAADWLEAGFVLPQMDAVVLSIEDVDSDERLIQSFAEACDLLLITEGAGGCRLFRSGYSIRIPAPEEDETDATGSGDIFAAVFFAHFYRSGDPEEAARMAVRLASTSVRRKFLDSIPTEAEIYEATLKNRRSEWASTAP